jgi:NADPH-dependent glutamate synthase beta subunit-like oxidoreductase/NAD-dependent dihydropyrimidine dehydrogenase PreA subunit
MAKGVSVIGSGIQAAQCALTLAEMGIDVSLITPTPALDLDSGRNPAEPSHESLHVWPLLLRAASHPRVKLYTNSYVKSVTGKPGNFVVKAQKEPRYVKEDLCTGCGKCEEECSVRVQNKVNGHKATHGAIHSPIIGAKSVPSAYYIEKEGISPCRANCPLGINVQGYIALLGKGKVDKALALINETAPMAGVLGRLCTHPCETKCTREKVDSPVYIQSLHRYASDNAPGGVIYTRKAPAGSRKEKIAIIGSGPAGLTAAWELARRGYSPTIFESHAVIGGMLATGIPRFRLSHEIREREVEAIKALGVDIKTGVTVGQDVTYTDLIDRGYKAFFLAIGANQNNKLGVPGEDLNGVLDCISLLFSLNQKLGTSVGSNVVVIGGGNSAVDSARSARRVSKGEVRILCVTDQMTAVKEEVDEAIKEGIPIDYNVSMVEVLGDGANVTGVRCMKVKNVTFDTDGKINMEYIQGSEFTLKADRVVVAIGQRPNSAALNIKNLNFGRGTCIAANPLTLETSIPGIFAGGDAVTGSNNVVSAMASGLRAAESIDRYIKGHDLKKGRILEPPVPVEVDLEDRKAAPHKRAKMPSLPAAKRKGNYEETNLGLPEDLAKRETERCLNCAICCECLECELACELKAVNHQDTVKSLDIESESVINFISQKDNIREVKKTGIYNVADAGDCNIPAELGKASAVALSAAIDLKLKEVEKTNTRIPVLASQPRLLPVNAENRTAVFLCRCGDGISSVIDLIKVSEAISTLPEVYNVQEIAQSCVPEAAKQIKDYVEKEKISHVVLAACRCCNLEQICFSCTDRRVMCQRNLIVDLPPCVNIEFANIREQCAWIHKDDPAGATTKAIEIIIASLIRAQKMAPAVYEPRAVTNSALVIGAGLSGLAAARNMAVQGYGVTFISALDVINLKKQSAEYRQNADMLLKELMELNVRVNPWPQALELNGAPGKYEAVMKYGEQTSKIEAGVVILDLYKAGKDDLDVLANSNLISRVIARQHNMSRISNLDATTVHSFTVRETAGIFMIAPAGEPSTAEQITMGEATAARASTYLTQETFKPRSSSVVINKKMCRGCGDCVSLCPYIELQPDSRGVSYASIDPALCFGCGACISVCPTGAISQPLQSESGITAALESLLKKAKSGSEA